MNRFIIVDGLPYLYANGKAYACRFDENGFTLGAEVEITSVPSETFSEISIVAKCAGNLDSISAHTPEVPQDNTPEGQEAEPEAEQEKEPEAEQQDNTPEAEQDNTPEGQEAEPEAEQELDFESMKLDELKQYAADNNISLNGARTKPTIIEAIKNASVE